MTRSVHDTPAMRQYRQFKEKHPECILLFRMGDFYELFYDDAKTVARALGLTLTQRTEGIPMAGVPYHQLDNYLRRLLQQGFRVAVCDQVEDAKQAKGVVKRDVTRLVTPGTLTDDSLLQDDRENPLAAISFRDDRTAHVALVDLSTGAFRVAELSGEAIRDELIRFGPTELLYVETADGRPPPRIAQVAEATGCALTPRPAWQFRPAEAHEALVRQFQVATLEGFGLADDDPVVGPSGAVVHYLLETQVSDDGRLAHLQPPRRFAVEEHLVIDPMALRALEVERTMRSGEATGSLLGTLNDCRTAMGKRLMRRWLCYPLRDRERIERRQAIVAAIVDDPTFRDALKAALDEVQDVERICSRVAIGRPSPRDLAALGESTAHIAELRDLIADRPALAQTVKQLDGIAAALGELAKTLHAACIDTPPAHLREGGLIRDGYDAELDEYRSLQRDSHRWLAEYQKELIEQTGIDRLKVGYNKVFGYYIEISHAQSGKAPDHFTRKQTLKNAERYITPKLKEFESKVLSAETRAIDREQTLFDQLVAEAAQRLPQLQQFAEIVSRLDVLASFARRAVKFGYIRPEIVDAPRLAIDAGRHPVLDEMLADQFVPNDVVLGPRAGEAGPGAKGRGPREEAEGEGARGAGASSSGPGPSALGPSSSAHGPTLALITGPNMAGKSTYIRQTALLVLLAHTGSFIPAERAVIGLTDRIYTRIGASDELHAGQSTFMVEMVETANICHHATPQSLVILDEIGRGTSTLDGLSLAWAIAEHLARRGCRTLFATHYHELTELAEQFDNVANLNVTVREWADQVVFLHRIQPGATDRSYGVHVAKIAGLPAEVVDRAHDVMGQLELSTRRLKPEAEDGNPKTGGGTPKGRRGSGAAPGSRAPEPTLFTQYVEHPAVEKLRDVDLNALTPLQAFDLLRRIKEELGE